MGIYTDMAVESHDYYQEKTRGSLQGVKLQELADNGIKTTIVDILDEVGASSLAKPIGRYITIDIPKEVDDHSKLILDCKKALTAALKMIITPDIKDDILIVGLGNEAITADALGVRATKQITATRHLFNLIPEEMQEGVRQVACLIPGVLGTTGVETMEIVRGIVDKIKPKMVIAIDSLASRKMERVASSIQVANTGLSPGSGIGNHRNKLNKETLGVPVIAIGVPTVVDAATLANDVLDLILPDEDSEERYLKISQVITPSQMGNAFVTPKEIDSQIKDLSDIISEALNSSLHEVEI